MKGTRRCSGGAKGWSCLSYFSSIVPFFVVSLLHVFLSLHDVFYIKYSGRYTNKTSKDEKTFLCKRGCKNQAKK
jgi:hypothetical protein